jgi:hypothetical protein
MVIRSSAAITVILQHGNFVFPANSFEFVQLSKTPEADYDKLPFFKSMALASESGAEISYDATSHRISYKKANGAAYYFAGKTLDSLKQLMLDGASFMPLLSMLNSCSEKALKLVLPNLVVPTSDFRNSVLLSLDEQTVAAYLNGSCKNVQSPLKMECLISVLPSGELLFKEVSVDSSYCFKQDYDLLFGTWIEYYSSFSEMSTGDFMHEVKASLPSALLRSDVDVDLNKKYLLSEALSEFLSVEKCVIASEKDTYDDAF